MALSEIKRKQIIDSATVEFREQGFQGCSMDAIAARAQVSKRTVYNHFASKEELFLSIVQDLIEQNKLAANQPFSTEKPVRDQLMVIAREEIEILQAEETQIFARILLGELVRSEEMARIFDKQNPSCQDNFTAWLSDACADGTMNVEELELAAEQFFGLLKTFAFWPTLLRQAELSDDEKELAVKSTVDMFLNTYAVVN